MVYEYTKLRGPFEVKQRYNVFGVVKQIKRKTSEINGKRLTKFSIVDETVIEPFCVTIFCRNPDEVIPEITEGSIVRLHRMVVEAFNKSIDGRVFSPSDVAFIPKAFLASLDWTSSAKKLTITDADNDRATELLTWVETVAHLPKLIDEVLSDEVSGGTVGIPGSLKATSDKGIQTEVSYPQSIKKTASAHSLSNDKESRKRRYDEVLNFEPSVADLNKVGFKDLLLWKCICSSVFRTSELLWCPGPKRMKNMGSTKCRDCGGVGLAIPRFHFYVRWPEVTEVQSERSLISGEEACEFLGTSILSYFFDDSESNECNRQLIARIQK